MPFLPALTCKRCSQPILLPFPIHDEIPPHQTPWPANKRPRNFLCLSCNRVCVYSKEDYHWHPAQSTDQYFPPHTPSEVLCISFPCDKNKCVDQIEIRAISPVGTVRQTAGSLLASAYLVGISCTKGHQLSEHWTGGSAAQVVIDTGWDLLTLD